MRLAVRPSVWFACALAYYFRQMAPLGMLMTCMAVHELGHLLIAELAGCRVRCLTVTSLGCSMLMEPEPAMLGFLELPLALAGPVLSGTFWMLARQLCFPQAWQDTNRILFAFNLLPLLPLDGGRALRSLLAHSLGLAGATRRTALFSAVLSCLLMAAGFFARQYALCVMVGFTLLESLREARRADWLWLRMLTQEKSRRMRRVPLPLKQLAAPAQMPLGQVLKGFSPCYYYQVLVVDAKGRPLALLEEERLVQALLVQGAQMPLGRIAP